MKKLNLGFTGLEIKLLFIFLTVFFLANIGLIRAFYVENSEKQPITGGEYIEGAVGTLSQDFKINPLFSENIEADISSLVFAGLMRYDPVSGEIRDHIATHTLSPNKKVYEFILKENVLWQDGVPVTAEDIMFTFQEVIQNPDFSNLHLKNAFSDVLVEQVDEKTVRFTIPETRKTFFTNFTTGLLPKHLLTGIPIPDLIYDPFNQSPIGCGQYRFEGIFRNTEFTEVRLTAYPDAFGEKPKIQTIGIRIFPSLDQLTSNISGLDAVQPLRTAEIINLPDIERFQRIETIGPRYIAVFFNLKEGSLTTKMIRQAMRAAIDTNTLAEEFKGVRVDTPFVELWPQTDIINISKERAEELLIKSGYTFPEEKVESSETHAAADETQIPAATPEPTPNLALTPAKYAYEPTDKKWYASSNSRFYLVGSFPAGTTAVTVNGYRLQLFNTASGRFSYLLDTDIGTMKRGENSYLIRFLNTSGAVIDSEEIKIYHDPDAQKIASVIAEKMATPAPATPPPTPTAEPTPTPSPTDFPSPTASESESPSRNPTTESTETPSETPDEPKITYRTNKEGEHLTLSLSYLKNYDYLTKLAEHLQKNWQEIGVEIILKPLDTNELREAIRTRSYELIMIPQHLGYNLDAYPYFHLSQVGQGGFNLSEWKNLKASVLLEEIRSSHDDAKRRDALMQLRDIFIDEVPAIMLFTPRYTWLIDQEIKNIDIQHLATLPDRFSRIGDYYMHEGRVMHEGVNFLNFLPWFQQKTRALFSFSSE